MKKDYVLSKGENKTLNAAFESEDYKEEYLDNYSKINYIKITTCREMSPDVNDAKI